MLLIWSVWHFSYTLYIYTDNAQTKSFASEITKDNPPFRLPRARFTAYRVCLNKYTKSVNGAPHSLSLLWNTSKSRFHSIITNHLNVECARDRVKSNREYDITIYFLVAARIYSSSSSRFYFGVFFLGAQSASQHSIKGFAHTRILLRVAEIIVEIHLLTFHTYLARAV